MTDKLKEIFDLKINTFIVGSISYFATVDVDQLMNYSLWAVTILIGILKLYEMFTGKKTSDLFKKEK